MNAEKNDILSNKRLIVKHQFFCHCDDRNRRMFCKVAIPACEGVLLDGELESQGTRNVCLRNPPRSTDVEYHPNRMWRQDR